ncbi:MAG: glycosyltransferase family 2 protein [Myxococcales bacterium]|jgi:glycosyltransferase involved in cell wall biosynthesis|nr:glycosyltransferase family 2 protein [Myxococcales bacterium]
MANVDVSVIIPTFHRERELVEAIDSALSQQGVEVEVIVLDDSPEASARSVAAAIDDPRVRYVARATPSGGRPAYVRNEGIELATGRYVYCLDDDDHVLPGALEALTDALDAAPQAGVAFGRVESFGPDPQIVESYRVWFDWAARAAARVSRSSWLTAGTILFRGTLIINSVCMMRRELARRLGGYDPAIPYYEDVEFFTRGIREFGHVFVDRPVLHYRTGRPSLIHDLRGDGAPIVESYKIMHDKYKARHGMFEYRALQIVSKLLPLDGPPPQ